MTLQNNFELALFWGFFNFFSEFGIYLFSCPFFFVRSQCFAVWFWILASSFVFLFALLFKLNMFKVDLYLANSITYVAEKKPKAALREKSWNLSHRVFIAMRNLETYKSICLQILRVGHIFLNY